MTSAGDAELWKNKYSELQKRFETLKTLANKAIDDYDALKLQNKEIGKQNDEFKQRLISTEAKLHGLETVLGPACDEFSQLQEKYELERTCRSEAENVAHQFYRQNQNLKRQSQLLLEKLDASELPVTELSAILEDEPEAGFNRDQDARVKQLQKQITELEEKLERCAEEQLNRFEQENLLKTECSHLKQELTAARQTIQEYRAAYDRLQEVSTLAVNDYNELKQKYEMEMSLNQEAVAYAHKMLSERDAIKRESSVLLASVSSDQRLADALLQVEQLSVQLSTKDKQHADQVKALEERIAMSEHVQRIAGLERKLELMSAELEACQKSYSELEKWKQKLEKENLILIDQLDVARQKLVPPPPPPPPPLPPTPLLLRPLKVLAFKKKMHEVDGGPTSPLTKTGKPKDETYEEALKEMMDRIKRGQGLKRVLKPGASLDSAAVTRPPPAINELQSILTRFKKGSFDSGDALSATA